MTQQQVNDMIALAMKKKGICFQPNVSLPCQLTDHWMFHAFASVCLNAVVSFFRFFAFSIGASRKSHPPASMQTQRLAEKRALGAGRRACSWWQNSPEVDREKLAPQVACYCPARFLPTRAAPTSALPCEVRSDAPTSNH